MMANEKDNLVEPGHDLTKRHEDPFIEFLHRIIRFVVKVLALLMVLVIVWGIGDVVYVLYQRIASPPFLLVYPKNPKIFLVAFLTTAV